MPTDNTTTDGVRFSLPKGTKIHRVFPTVWRSRTPKAAELRDGKLYATDGHILVCHDLHNVSPGHDPAPVSIEVLKDMAKGLPTTVQPDGSISLTHGPTYPPTMITGQSFPNWELITKAERPPVSISINTDLLKRLSEAMGGGSDVVTLHLDPEAPGKMVHVSRASAPNVHGYIMPVTLRGGCE